MSISAAPVLLHSLAPLRRVPQLTVRDSIHDILTDIRPCTLRELSIFGRGFNPHTSAVNVSGFLRGTKTYKDALINNLSPELYHQFSRQLALIFGCSDAELQGVGYFCYNVARGFNKREDVSPIPFQIGIADDGYVKAIGNEKGNSWIHIG